MKNQANYQKKTQETLCLENRKDVKTSMKSRIEKHFSAKRVALMAIFVALSFTVSLLSFSIFPTSPVFFLELDFGNVFILLISFLLGPVEGVVVCILKELFRMLAGSTGGVGEIANMITTCSFILLPSIVYQFKKGLPTVILTLLGACIIGTVAALLANRFITFPLFLKDAAVEVFYNGFWFIVAFNLIKTVSISVLTLLLYKRLSNFIKTFMI